MKCAQPGCSGRIEDGYCNVCGMPAGSLPAPNSAAPTAAAAARPAPDSVTPAATVSAAPVASVPAATASAATAPEPAHPGLNARPGRRPSSVAAGRCPMPGCGGEIRDGYCDICGSPPDAAAPPETGDTALAALTTTSTRLSSAALGSQLVARGEVTRRTTSTHRVRGARIGAGLTRVPPAPAVDPARAILRTPVVPEHKRTCPSCGAPVGRSRQGQPGRSTGFCAKCRNPFSFDPKLAAGDLVAGQYEVAGCLAHGGLGWIYLARDRNVSHRWVVLKGLLNSGDPDATAAAIAEQQFLAQVTHPLIVEIYNFVSHEGSGYIVMEFVGGRSLKQLLQDRIAKNGGQYDPLPVDQAIAYIVEVLPAFQYFHDQGLIYCDFKPDNVIQVGDGLKLIDLGGVRRVDDHDSAIFGTVGYQAPEVATQGVSHQSDIFTIGRTLMVLCAEFRGYQTTFEFTFPPVERTPLFQQNDSLYRLLQRCCAPDPADRFTSADELRVQLLGVLRETVARRTRGTALTSAASVLFESPSVVGSTLEWSGLPGLRIDSNDSQHGWLSNVSVDDPKERLQVLGGAPAKTPEVRLTMCRALLKIGNQRASIDELARALLTDDPWEWRAVWMQGLAALQAEDWTGAQAAFNAVYGQVPGELAPKLALALACEVGGQLDIAEGLYAACAATDANYVTPAAFGLARICVRNNDLDGAVAALDMVPATSRAYAESRRLRARHLLNLGVGLKELDEALRSVQGVRMDALQADEFTVQILERALGEVRAHGPRRNAVVGAHPATEDALRSALADAYRALARHQPGNRVELIDRANRLRKWSLL